MVDFAGQSKFWQTAKENFIAAQQPCDKCYNNAKLSLNLQSVVILESFQTKIYPDKTHM